MNPRLQTWLVRLWHRLVFRWRRDELAHELAEELEFHFEQKRAENLRAGISPLPFAELTRRLMGNITMATEECREMWSFMKWEHLLQDLRHALRAYARTPVFTGLCIFSIALVFVSFAGSAMLLAAAGIYGLMSHWASQRTYEIGLRVAMGCTRQGILSMILAQA